MVRAENYPSLKASNGNWVIDIYKTEDGMWTFQGNDRCEEENSLVAGIDEMLEYIKSKHGDFGDFRVQFGKDRMFVENSVEMLTFELIHDEVMDKFNKKGCGNNYYCWQLDYSGWLCPVLFDFFETAPETFYLYFVKK